MIASDYECKKCGAIKELLWSRIKPVSIKCEECGGEMKPIITMRQTSPIDAAWLHSVIEVVDKNSAKPHCQEFIRHPTRANYHKWMKGEKLRPLDYDPAPPKFKTRAEKIAEMKEPMRKAWAETERIEATTI